MSAARKSIPVRDLQREAEAAKALRQSLASMTDDPEAIRDTIEGETDLHECIAKVMAMVTEAEAQEEGLKVIIAKLDQRKKAAERRQDSLRTIIAQAMEIGGITTLPLTEATLSLAPVPPRAIVTDEAAVPAKFWKPSDPTLDRKALTDAVRAGEEVPGVTKSNGLTTLKIRRA